MDDVGLLSSQSALRAFENPEEFQDLMEKWSSGNDYDRRMLQNRILDEYIQSDDQTKQHVRGQTFRMYDSLSEEQKSNVPEQMRDSVDAVKGMDNQSQLVVFEEVALQLKSSGDVEEPMSQHEQILRVVRSVAKVERRNISDWVKRGPLSLRVLGFLAGVCLFIAGLIEFFIYLSASKFQPALLNFYCVLFGFIMAIMEVQTITLAKQKKILIDQLSFLNDAWIRSFFYIFCGTLTAGEWSWEASLDVLAAIMCFGVGFGQLVFTIMARHKLQNIELGDREECGRLFEEYDVDKNGYLDPKELSSLVLKLGSTLGHTELEAAIQLLDKDGNHKVDKEEFVNWFCTTTII